LSITPKNVKKKHLKERGMHLAIGAKAIGCSLGAELIPSSCPAVQGGTGK